MSILYSKDPKLISSIQQIANHPSVIKHCEPSVLFHHQVQSGEISRVILAIKLLIKEANDREKKT